MAQKITHFLLVTLILSLGFGQLLRFEQFGFTIYLHDVLVVGILILQFSFFKNLKLTKGVKILLIGILIGWLRALSLFPLSELITPFMYTVRLLTYLCLYGVLKKSQLTLGLSNKYIYLSGAITLLLGLGQYFILPDMRYAKHLGWDDHLNRLTLHHYDPTYTGIMLSIPALYMLITSSKFLLILFPYFLGILITYSRSVWLSLIVTFLVVAKNKLIKWVGVILFFVSVLLLPIRFGEGNNLLRTYSISSRLTSDISYIRSLNYNLISGVGLNTLSLKSKSNSIYSNHATGPNNSYLYILATTGIIGLLGLLTTIIEITRYSKIKPIWIFVLIASLFNNVLFYPFVILWLILVEAKNKD